MSKWIVQQEFYLWDESLSVFKDEFSSEKEARDFFSEKRNEFLSSTEEHEFEVQIDTPNLLHLEDWRKNGLFLSIREKK